MRDDAIVSAAELSARYITGRLLPDKAVDLLDTASARVRIGLECQQSWSRWSASRLALGREQSALLRDRDNGFQWIRAPGGHYASLRSLEARLNQSCSSVKKHRERATFRIQRRHCGDTFAISLQPGIYRDPYTKTWCKSTMAVPTKQLEYFQQTCDLLSRVRSFTNR